MHVEGRMTHPGPSASHHLACRAGLGWVKVVAVVYAKWHMNHRLMVCAAGLGCEGEGRLFPPDGGGPGGQQGHLRLPEGAVPVHPHVSQVRVSCCSVSVRGSVSGVHTSRAVGYCYVAGQSPGVDVDDDSECAGLQALTVVLTSSLRCQCVGGEQAAAVRGACGVQALLVCRPAGRY